MKEKMITNDKAKIFILLFSGLIIVLAVIFCGSGSAWAADVSNQAELEAALSDSDTVITLTGDITLISDITVSKEVTLTASVYSTTLDANNYTIVVASGGDLTVDGGLTITSSAEQTINVQNGGTFTLTDGDILSANGSAWHSAIYVEGGGTVNIDGGTVVSDDNRSEGAIYANGGIVTVNVSDGEITGYSHGIKIFYYDSTSSRSTVNISGGNITATAPQTAAQTYGLRIEKGNVTIDGDTEISAQFPVTVDVGSLNIANGTISGGISLKDCPTEISGGTINCGTSYNVSISDTSAVTATGGTINGPLSLDNCDTIDISDGTFSSSAGSALYLSGVGNTTISGGTLSGSVGVEVYSVDNEKNVAISGDAEITGTTYGLYSAGGNVTIAGEDVVISGGTKEYGFGGVSIASGGKVTMSAGSVTGAGTSSDRSFGGVYIMNGGEMTVTGGTIANANTNSGTGGIYIESGGLARITSGEDLDISGYVPVYCAGGYSTGIPEPQTMALGETNKRVDLPGFSGLGAMIDTTATSSQLGAANGGLYSYYLLSPTAIGNYNLVISCFQEGKDYIYITIPVKVAYSVTYNANGGTGTTPAKIYKDAAETFTSAASNTFTPPTTGKQFKEWNTADGGTGGTSYAAGAMVTMPASNLTLYAIWEDIPAATLESIEITTLPTKLVYTVGDSLDITGMVVTGTYSDSSTSTLSVTAADVSGFDSSAPAASQTLTVTIGGKTDTYTISINPVATYAVSLSPPAGAPYFFDTKPYGYAAITPLTVTVTNTGNQPTGALNVIKEGAHPDSYTVSPVAINSLEPYGSASFTVRPVTGLATGTYVATAGVTGNYGIRAGIPFMFTVNDAMVDIPAIPGVTAPVAGRTLDTEITETAQYTGTIAWAPTDSPFVKDTVYTATITLTAKSGYSFNTLAENFFTVSGAASVTNPLGTDSTITVTVVFPATSASSSGGGGGGGGTASTPVYKAKVKAGNGTETTLTVTVDKETAFVDAGSQSLAQGGNVTVTMPSVPGITNYIVGMPVEGLITGDGTLTFNTDTGSLTLPWDMLSGIPGTEGKKAEITIGVGDKSDLPDDVRTAIGDRPLISLSLSLDGEPAEWSNPDAPVTVSIPYEPTQEELANPEGIVVWYIDGSGNLIQVSGGRYDSASGTVIFQTTHFSYYAVGYNKTLFSDVLPGTWYYEGVNFIAEKGITTGTGDGKFSPEAKLTRGDFLVMLMKAYGIAPDTDTADNFSDAGNTYYTGYLAAAKRLGITGGIGNNLFAPGREITRQEMFTLLHNSLKAIGQLPQGSTGKSLSDFSDAGQIAPWAQEAMALLVGTGTVSGSNGLLSPEDTTTRAQMAQVLYNLLSK